MSFILTWVATVFLLHNHSSKLGRAKYWILVPIPLVHFLGQFQPLFLTCSNHFVFLSQFFLGLFTLCFLARPYLFLIGIYSSSISVAEDSNLRRSIRSFAMKESKLLDSIGTAQMEQEIQKKVITFTKRIQDRMTEESEIQSSLTEEDMKEYLEQVIRAVKKDRQAEK